MTHIVSFSGGKDSTAMLLMMIEKNMPIDEIIFCDTGMEFPAMYEHIQKVEKFINRKITILKNEKTFEYYLSDIKIKTGKRQGQFGYGWAGHIFRWCTKVMKHKISKDYLKNKNYILYIGIAVDEQKRLQRSHNRQKLFKFPLNEWGISEEQALQYCYKRGLNWGGLYEKFKRVSCWCCPLQSIGSARILYNDFPELWQELKRLDKLSYRQFKSDYSVDDLEKRFASENKQRILL